MVSSNKVVSIIVAIIVFVVGVGVGFLLQSQRVSPESETYQTTVKQLSSKVIPSIAAYGQVSDISGNNLTITYSGDSLTVGVGSDAKIYSFAKTEGNTTPTQQDAKFEDIKKGDSLSIGLKLSSEGELKAQTIIILPFANQ